MKHKQQHCWKPPGVSAALTQPQRDSSRADGRARGRRAALWISPSSIPTYRAQGCLNPVKLSFFIYKRELLPHATQGCKRITIVKKRNIYCVWLCSHLPRVLAVTQADLLPTRVTPRGLWGDRAPSLLAGPVPEAAPLWPAAQATNKGEGQTDLLQWHCAWIRVLPHPQNALLWLKERPVFVPLGERHDSYGSWHDTLCRL